MNDVCPSCGARRDSHGVLYHVDPPTSRVTFGSEPAGGDDTVVDRSPERVLVDRRLHPFRRLVDRIRQFGATVSAAPPDGRDQRHQQYRNTPPHRRGR